MPENNNWLPLLDKFDQCALTSAAAAAAWEFGLWAAKTRGIGFSFPDPRGMTNCHPPIPRIPTEWKLPGHWNLNNWLPLQTNLDQCAPTSAAAAWEFGLWAAWGLFSQFVLCCPLDDPVGIIIITIIPCDLWERTLQSDRAYTTFFFSFSIDDIWENRKLPLHSKAAESLKIKGVNCQIKV